MILVELFFLLIVYPCEGLLQGSDNPSTGELLSLIHQLNQTLQTQREKLAAQEVKLAAQDVNLAKQNNEIAVLKASHQSSHVAFYAELGIDITLGQHQIVKFDHVITNEGNAFDARHGHFTAPVNGIYIFSVTIMKTGRELHVEIVKNGIEISRAYSDTGNYNTGSATVFLQLNTGDMVWVRDNPDHDSETIHGDHYSSFGGALVSKM